MNSFVKLLRNLTTQMKTYKCSDLEVRVFKGAESYKDSSVVIYEKTQNSKSYPLNEHEYVITATNIEDAKDVIDYKLLALPGGRVRFGGYLYPEDLDESEFNLYSFKGLWYKIFGEELPTNKSFTIEELKGVLPIFESRINLAKYKCLYELRYKDSFHGETKFKGSKYFGGILEGTIMQYEQINGNDNIRFEEIISNYKEDDTVFELINLATVHQNSRIYDISYFTKEALSNMIELREKEKGVSK